MIYFTEYNTLLSERKLKKILRPDEEDKQVYDIEELIKNFGEDPSLVYYYDETNTEDDNMYSLAAEHLFKKFLNDERNKFIDAAEDVKYRLIAFYHYIFAACFKEIDETTKCICISIDDFSLPEDFALSLHEVF